MKKKAALAIFAILLTITSFAFAAADKVYVTPNGKKYHARACKTIATSMKILELTPEQAESRGYKPCKVCLPQKTARRQK